jgi:hypothetical protein
VLEHRRPAFNQKGHQAMTEQIDNTTFAPELGNLDSRIVAVCAQFDAAENERLVWHRANPDDNNTQALEGRFDAIQCDLVAELAALKSRTFAGLRAKTASLTLWAPELLDEGNDIAENLLASLLNDLLAFSGDGAAKGGVNTQPIPDRPDTALLALCADFQANERAITDAPNDEAGDSMVAHLLDRRHGMLQQIAATEAKTAHGTTAKSRCYGLVLPDLIAARGGERLLADIERAVQCPALDVVGRA